MRLYIIKILFPKNIFRLAKVQVYPITFDLKGGEFGSGITSPSCYDITSATIVLNKPVRKGYTFEGWTGSNGDTPQKEVSIESGSTGTRSYTANWSLTVFNIAYDLCDGVETTNPTTYTVTTEKITLKEPTKEHYTFVGWTGSNGNTPQKEVSIAKGSTGNKSYKANWKNEIMTFDLPDGIKLELVYCPPGTFMMGSPENEVGRAENEDEPLEMKSARLEVAYSSDIETLHHVTLTKGFYIGKFEVTQEQFYAVMHRNPSHFADGNKPVEALELYDFMEFCNELNGSQLHSRYLFGDS